MTVNFTRWFYEMHFFLLVLLVVVSLQCFLVYSELSEINEQSTYEIHPGHMKPFGSVGPYAPKPDEIVGFPTTGEFFNNYVQNWKPLIMREAGKLSAAFERWTDDYFLSLDIPSDNTVSVERGKKENRNDPLLELNFREFVTVYNTTDQYMVDSVPEFLRSDVLLPGPLQCSQISQQLLIENVMWMSSGGTSSVVHTDSVDNIICVFRGSKQLVLVDPSKYRDKVEFDHPEGGYSGIDVLRVDYLKYPSLADVTYHIFNLSAGDCLYIPYKWIHQVSSYNSNIAVNVWWNHRRIKEVNLDLCPDVFDRNLSIDKVEFQGFESELEDLDGFREYFQEFVRKDLNLDQFVSMFFEEEDDRKLDPVVLAPLRHTFQKIDMNYDKIISRSEVLKLSDKDWELIQMYMNHFDMEMQRSVDEGGNEIKDYEYQIKDNQIKIEDDHHKNEL